MVAQRLKLSDERTYELMAEPVSPWFEPQTLHEEKEQMIDYIMYFIFL
jgi:hypothetical protein